MSYNDGGMTLKKLAQTFLIVFVGVLVVLIAASKIGNFFSGSKEAANVVADNSISGEDEKTVIYIEKSEKDIKDEENEKELAKQKEKEEKEELAKKKAEVERRIKECTEEGYFKAAKDLVNTYEYLNLDESLIEELFAAENVYVENQLEEIRRLYFDEEDTKAANDLMNKCKIVVGDNELLNNYEVFFRKSNEMLVTNLTPLETCHEGIPYVKHNVNDVYSNDYDNAIIFESNDLQWGDRYLLYYIGNTDINEFTATIAPGEDFCAKEHENFRFSVFTQDEQGKRTALFQSDKIVRTTLPKEIHVSIPEGTQWIILSTPDYWAGCGYSGDFVCGNPRFLKRLSENDWEDARYGLLNM